MSYQLNNKIFSQVVSFDLHFQKMLNKKATCIGTKKMNKQVLIKMTVREKKNDSQLNLPRQICMILNFDKPMRNGFTFYIALTL